MDSFAMRWSMVKVVVVLGAGCAALWSVACSSDEKAGGSGGSSGAATGGSSGSSAGSAGSAGAGGSAGSSATGGVGGSSGTGGAAGAEAGVACQDKPPLDPGGTTAEFDTCCGGLGRCTSASNIDSTQAAGLGLETCLPNANLKCAPISALISQDGGVDAATDGAAAEGGVADGGLIPATCRSSGDSEGRCVPSCFTLGDPASAQLPQATCQTGAVCVPCFSPVSASATGACTTPGDAPTEAAKTFQACGAPADGVCVPSASLPPGPALPQVDCPTDFVCAPAAKVKDPNACFDTCTTGGVIPGLDGACIPAFVVDPSQAGALVQSTCAAGELCAPCISPLDSKPTGACD